MIEGHLMRGTKAQRTPGLSNAESARARQMAVFEDQAYREAMRNEAA